MFSKLLPASAAPDHEQRAWSGGPTWQTMWKRREETGEAPGHNGPSQAANPDAADLVDLQVQKSQTPHPLQSLENSVVAAPYSPHIPLPL